MMDRRKCLSGSKKEKFKEKMRFFKLFLLLNFLLFTSVLMAQPRLQKVQLMAVPDHSDALYKCGEKVKMKLMAFHCGMALNGAVVKYHVSKDLMEPHIESSVELNGNEATIDVGTLKEPGYLRVKAYLEKDGKSYSVLSTVGFDTHRLEPTVTMPKDFMAFWEEGIKMLQKTALDAQMELLEERCTKSVDVYHISYKNIGGSRMYGMLTVPKAPGKYPAILRFPGAGVGEKGGDIAHAERGVIVLELGIHGIPVNYGGNIYEDLGNGPLKNYPEQNMDNRDTYYYKRVYLGCVKGIEFLLSLPQCNGNIGTFGGSQGGALSIVTSALDKRVKADVAYFPALSDMEGYCHNRAGGWPHIFKNEANRTKEIINTIRYYDVANFARIMETPVHFLYGYNDITCAPTTTRSTYNAINSPKELIIGENIGHWTYPDQMETLWNWIIKKLK